MSVFGFSFLAPLALLGLVALPALWWLLRATPPAPSRTVFPPLRLLAGLVSDEETPVKTPWWLIALRLALLTLLILAFAGPIWRAASPVALPGEENTPLLIVLETGWSSAADWETRLERTGQIIAAADASDRPMAVVASPQPDATAPLPGDAAAAQAVLTGLQPHAARQDWAALLDRLEGLLASPGWQGAALVWIGDGLAFPERSAERLAALSQDHPITLLDMPYVEVALTLERGADGPAARLHAVAADEAVDTTRLQVDETEGDARRLVAFDGSGRTLGSAALAGSDGIAQDRIAFDLPRDLRNDIARIAVVPTRHAGEVLLVDDRAERRRVGIVSGEAADQAQPLLAGSTYVERALRPISDVAVPRTGDVSAEIAGLIEEGVDVLMLVDAASLIPSTVRRLEDWMERGGVLVRFASSGLTQSTDGLLPVPLRAVDRQLGGTLTWEEPQAIAAFAPQSPFFGLTIPEDVRVTRQVLSEPGAALASRTYAELADATPLATGMPRGNGHLILFHITADTDWSNLPLSGLFPTMLQRLIDLSVPNAATGTFAPAQAETSAQSAPADLTASLAPRQTLDGFGRLTAPPSHVEALVPGSQSEHASLATPPGFYGPAASTLALNLFEEAPDLRPLSQEQIDTIGASLLAPQTEQSFNLRPTLITLIVVLALIDAVIMLVITGALRGLGRRAAQTTASLALALPLAAALIMALPQSGWAQSRDGENGELERLLAAVNTTRLAFVLTGDAEVDQRSREGMSGITRVLAQRTAFEPGEPMAIDPAEDELSIFPLIYWAMPEAPIAVSDDLVTRIDAYMNNGGTILFDTRDEAANPLSASISPQTANLRTLLAALDIPPLEPVPEDHVLTKAFYLLDSFPGRFGSGPLWVEALPEDGQTANRPARGGDGVSPILITGNDFASAWALSSDGRALYATSPPDPVQREFAYRTGVNIGMYVMTGNYKADQVHVPALLERLVR
ncbi:MAG: DUF4159 domain-containing protein [Cohaesibacteraceae bacterium]